MKPILEDAVVWLDPRRQASLFSKFASRTVRAMFVTFEKDEAYRVQRMSNIPG